MTYGNVLRKLLRESHVSQADLARSIGKSNSYVSQLCEGKIQEPTLTMASAIAIALNTNLQTFLDLMNE